MLKLGANPDIRDNYGYTALRYAVKRDMELGGGFEDIYELMLSKTDLNSTDNSKTKGPNVFLSNDLHFRGPDHFASGGRSSS